MFLPQLRLFKYSTKKQFFLGIFKRKILREKERKHALDREKSENHEKKKENTLTTKKKIRKRRSRARYLLRKKTKF